MQFNEFLQFILRDFFCICRGILYEGIQVGFREHVIHVFVGDEGAICVVFEAWRFGVEEEMKQGSHQNLICTVQTGHWSAPKPAPLGRKLEWISIQI